MEQIHDIVRNDAFSYTSLQRVVDNAPYVPTMLGNMRLYESKPITTREVMIYEKDGGFAMIPYSQIGGPDAQQIRRQGRLFAIGTNRVSKKDTVHAGELTGILSEALAPSAQVRSFATLLNDRTINLKKDMEATKEFARLGGIQGKIYDPVTGELVVDYFSEFNVSEPTVIEVDFASDDLGEREALMYFQETVFVPMRLALENRWTPNTEIHSLVGDEFWGKLMRLPTFAKLYELMLQGRMMAMAQNPLAKPNAWETVYFGGIYWTNFRGSTGGEIDIEPDEALCFPVGAKDTFAVYWAPGEKLKDATAPGRAEYLYLEPDPRQNPEWLEILLRSYFAYVNLFPKALLKLRVKP